MTEYLEYTLQDGIATVTLNRPDSLNAYDIGMKEALIAVLDRVDNDDDVRVVIVTGAGKAFCAGMDLSPGPRTFARLAEEPADRRRDSGGELALRIYALTKPIIGAINGAAIGVGATMTLPMDIRLASYKANFGFVFARRGIVLESCSSWFLPRIVGISRAAEWALTGRIVNAQQALDGGLVSRLCEPDELLPEARAIAAEIVEHTAPVSVALNRQLMWRMLGEPHPMAANVAESRAMFLRGQSPDSEEGVASFLERRAARFTESVPSDLPDVFPGRREPTFSS